MTMLSSRGRYTSDSSRSLFLHLAGDPERVPSDTTPPDFQDRDSAIDFKKIWNSKRASVVGRSERPKRGKASGAESTSRSPLPEYRSWIKVVRFTPMLTSPGWRPVALLATVLLIGGVSARQYEVSGCAITEANGIFDPDPRAEESGKFVRYENCNKYRLYIEDRANWFLCCPYDSKIGIPLYHCSDGVFLDPVSHKSLQKPVKGPQFKPFPKLKVRQPKELVASHAMLDTEFLKQTHNKLIPYFMAQKSLNMKNDLIVRLTDIVTEVMMGDEFKALKLKPLTQRSELPESELSRLSELRRDGLASAIPDEKRWKQLNMLLDREFLHQVYELERFFETQDLKGKTGLTTRLKRLREGCVHDS